MPFINVQVGKTLTTEKKEEVMKSIASHISIIPTKTIDNAMIEIDTGKDMYMGGEKRELLFMDIRLSGPSPYEAKDEFIKTMTAEFERILEIPGKNMYFNTVELPEWGTCNGLKVVKK